MPAPDLVKDYGWGKVFFKTADRPTLPEQLTSKWWSKQKQLIASGKETGIGEALDELQKLFKPVTFYCIIGRVDTKDHDEKMAEESMKSPKLTAFAKQAKKVKELAEKHADLFKGATAKTGAALAVIGETAAALEEVCDEKHLKGCLKKALNDAKDNKLNDIIERAPEVLEARDGVLKKIPAGLEELKSLVSRFTLDRKPATAKQIGGAMTSYCRDMTQVLFNMLKMDDGGYTLDGFEANKGKIANDELVYWADTKTGITFETPQAAIDDLKKIGEATKKFIMVTKGVKLPKVK